MLYCPPNVTLGEIWVNHGISHCFLDTVTSGVYGSFLLLFGLGQWGMYRRYATPTEPYLRPRAPLLWVQVALSVIMMAVAAARLILQATVIGDHKVYGYMVVSATLSLACWPLSLRLVFLERHYQLPSVPSQGHGFVLLVFWTLVFVTENLAFLNLRNEDWWFNLVTTADKLEFSLFLARYSSGCLLFILGLKAPGISTMRDYMSFGGRMTQMHDDDDQDVSYGGW